MTRINTALVGYGSGGRIYNAPIISSVAGYNISKILTSNPENVAAAQKDFPKATVVSEFTEILNDPEITLTVITVPNHLHFAYASKALKAGKHVLVEKPFTPSLAEADELIALAEEKNLILSINHNRRWDSDFRTVQKIVKAQQLGKIVSFEAHFDRFRDQVKNSWKEEKEIPGSGILYDLGSHLIDQALSLFGPPKELFAHLEMQREKATVPDHFQLILFYPQLKVTLQAGMLVKQKGPTYSLYGTQGSFIKYGVDPQEAALKKGDRPADSTAWGKEPEQDYGQLDLITGSETIRVPSETGDYRKVYTGLRDAILKGTPAPVTPQQARDVIKVIELAVKSNEQKRVLSYNN
jgi:scyllo-inositol 2-dehydrogenase (NADP+)